MSTPEPSSEPGGAPANHEAGADATHKGRRTAAWTALGVVGALVAVILVLGFTPLFDDDLESNPDPAGDYAGAMAKADALLAQDGDDINPLCRSQVLDKGQRTERSVVLLHGYTNCPEQFSVMAQAYSDAGYNVVVARLPQHGEADRMTKALSDLTPGDLTALADQTVDIAAGLGERVTVVGLSGGGTMAAWLAAQRDDVAEAVLLAPLVVPKVLPEFTVGPVARIGSVLPDIYLWWDGSLKEKLATPPYAYPRYSLHSLGAILAVGRDAQGRIGRTNDLERLVVITNDNDNAVKNTAIDRLGSRLADRSIEDVTYTFTDDLDYKHDLVDPQGENAEDLPAIYATLGPLLGLPNLADALSAAP